MTDESNLLLTGASGVGKSTLLKLVAGGTSNKEIGQQLHISEATVKSHLSHIFGKLEVDDRTAAVTAALERGIILLGRS